VKDVLIRRLFFPLSASWMFGSLFPFKICFHFKPHRAIIDIDVSRKENIYIRKSSLDDVVKGNEMSTAIN
jgi:hypothetical protein